MKPGKRLGYSGAADWIKENTTTYIEGIFRGFAIRIWVPNK